MNKYSVSKSTFEEFFVNSSEAGKTGSSVSSDPLNISVSNEDKGVVAKGVKSTTSASAKTEKITNSCNGILNIGELETLPNFNPQRALSEGMDLIPIDKLENIPEMKPKGEEEESICENDDRSQVMNTTTVPWRWICKLLMTFPDGSHFVGTGWFIGPKAVMTAGHCVHSIENGGWASQIIVIPGMQGEAQPFGSIKATSFRSNEGWTKNQDSNYDYGCIILPSPELGNQVGYFGFAALDDDSLKDILVNNSGYPGDKPAGTQWFNAGRVTNVTAQKIKYMLDTYGGQSGSPTWRTQNGQYTAIGVHAYGGCPNGSTRITEKMYNNMVEWRDS